MLWAEYHRRQARTLVNLALLTDNRDTALTLMTIARHHAEKAKQAEERSKDALPEAAAPSIQPMNL